MNISSLPKPYQPLTTAGGSNKTVSSEKISTSSKRTDTVSLSGSSVSRITSSLDKGTAANTTMFLDRSSFDSLMKETTFGKTKWEEMGGDDTKMWVVVNGQRFEYQRSPDEIAERKRIQEMAGKTRLDYLEDAQKEQKAQLEKGKEIKSPTLENGKLLFDPEDVASDSKLADLVKNKPVMEVLSRLAAQGVNIQMHS